MGERWDCLVVGAGPAGLTAGLYLGRFRRRVLVTDGGPPRAALIPTSHNITGFPDGIGGHELLARMRSHATRYGAVIVPGRVTRLERGVDGFAAMLDGRPIKARTAVLATGAVDVEPALPNVADAVRRGLIRHCPICDGFEVSGQRIGVIGFGAEGAGEALFLRTWCDDITLLTLARPMGLSDDERGRLAAAGIKMVEEAVRKVTLAGKHICGIETERGLYLSFDTLYSALGARNANELAVPLGARVDGCGAIVTGAHQEAGVDGLYAVGDVTSALNQVAVAAAQGAIAATAIHRRLLTAPG